MNTFETALHTEGFCKLNTVETNQSQQQMAQIYPLVCLGQLYNHPPSHANLITMRRIDKLSLYGTTKLNTFLTVHIK